MKIDEVMVKTFTTICLFIATIKFDRREKALTRFLQRTRTYYVES
jgi:hypothetical protein